MSDPDLDPVLPTPAGGKGGAPDLQQRLASGGIVRRKRLQRLLATAALKAARASATHADAVGDALKALRAIVLDPDCTAKDAQRRSRAIRESRLASAALLQHYRALSGLEPESPAGGDQHLHLHGDGGLDRTAYQEAMADPETRDAALKMLAFVAQRDRERSGR